MAVHVHHAVAKSGDGDDDKRNHMDEMREMFGPGHVDQTVRGAIQACWMALPKERRNVAEVDKEIRRLVERALSNLREDVAAFGGPGEG
jgi:hypothetical protein